MDVFPDAETGPAGIAAAPDGDPWYAKPGANKIATTLRLP